MQPQTDAKAEAPMQINKQGPLERDSDLDLIARRLPLENGRLLELGCGGANVTRLIAERFPVAEIIATEVDRIQHEKNLQITDLPKVTFKYGGAEFIDLPDASVDAVIMLKSLHHVPAEVMDQGFAEIARVLKPGGLAYISEPIYGGAFNEILRLFNDEKAVREAAFAATQRAVESGLLELDEEIFFEAESRFAGWEGFEQRIIGATHSEFDIDDALYARIKEAFMPHVADGEAVFYMPIRVDLLRKPVAG